MPEVVWSNARSHSTVHPSPVSKCRTQSGVTRDGWQGSRLQISVVHLLHRTHAVASCVVPLSSADLPIYIQSRCYPYPPGTASSNEPLQLLHHLKDEARVIFLICKFLYSSHEANHGLQKAAQWNDAPKEVQICSP